MIWFRQQLFSVVAWTTIPFVLASGMPRVGCLCANGDHRPFCQGIQPSASVPAKACADCSGCDCCAGAKVRAPTESKRTPACCGQAHEEHIAGAAASHRCCQPYLIPPNAVKNYVAAPACSFDDDCTWQSEEHVWSRTAANGFAVDLSRHRHVCSGVDILHRCCVLVI